MADQKVSDLPSLNGADVDAADLLYIIDSSAGSAGSKKITVGQYQLAPVSGGTANGVVYLNASKVATAGSDLVFDGSNLGIGTSSPGAKLESVASGTAVYFSGGDSSVARRLQFNATTTTNTGDTQNINALGSTGVLVFSTNTTERMRLDSSGNLGIGTTNTSGIRLGVDAGATAIVANFNSTAANGGYIRFQSSGTTYGDIGTAAEVVGGSASDFGINARGSRNLILGANNTERARITSGGEVYIAGTTDQGAYNLQVNGTGVWGAGAYVNGSDERLKDNIQTLDDGLSVVSQLRPVTFQYKPEHSKDQSVQPGFIAQELQQAMTGKDYVGGVVMAGPEYLNVAYQNLIPILTKAIQEQQALITDLRARVAALESA